MKDALSTFEPKSGLFLKFSDGDEIKLRVLTLDPVITETTFENDKTGEITISTKYNFVVWNWTDNKPQILSVGPGLLNRFVRIHRDADLPALNKADIKITATGEQLKRRYEVMVLPATKEITPAIIAEARQVKLEEVIKDHKGRLSEYTENDEGDDSETLNDEPASDGELGSDEQLKANIDKTLGEETEVVDLNDSMPDGFLL